MCAHHWLRNREALYCIRCGATRKRPTNDHFTQQLNEWLYTRGLEYFKGIEPLLPAEGKYHYVSA